MKVFELIEKLRQCDPNAIVASFCYDKEMGNDITCVTSNGKYYRMWDKYQVIDGHLASGNNVVVLSDYNLEAKYPPEEDDEWDD